MKESFLLCVALAVVVSSIKLVLASASERTARLLQLLLDTAILVILICGAGGVDSSFSFAFRENAYFEQYEAEMVDKVVNEAEILLCERVENALLSEFGVAPRESRTEIDRETFELYSMQVFYNASDIKVSAFEVKRYIKREYGIEAEVYFT